MNALSFRVILAATATAVGLLAAVSVNAGSTPGNTACQFFDEFIDNGDGTVTDPRARLVWKRCAEGFEWSGSRCLGAERQFFWHDAMTYARDHRFLGKNDWRLPTKSELESVVGSSTKSQCQDNKYWSGQYAASSMLAHALRDDKYPGYFYSSTAAKKDDEVWVVFFFNGDSDERARGGRGKGYHVRLVQNGSNTEFQREQSRVPLSRNRTEKAQAEDAKERQQAKRERCPWQAGEAITIRPKGFAYGGSVLNATISHVNLDDETVSISARDTIDNRDRKEQMSCYQLGEIIRR